MKNKKRKIFNNIKLADDFIKFIKKSDDMELIGFGGNFVKNEFYVIYI